MGRHSQDGPASVDQVLACLTALRETRLDSPPSAGPVLGARMDALLEKLWDLLPEDRRRELRGDGA